MEIKILETSLNLRIEPGKRKEDYLISQSIAKKQLSFMDDIYTNVEFMDCDNADYLQLFADAEYNNFTSLDSKGRGILCEIKKEYIVNKIGEMTKPHMLHLRIKKENEYIDLITIRLLVAGGDNADFKNRKKQWKDFLDYIDSLADKSHVLLIGDFNHGVICRKINGYRHKPRQYYNYQMVVSNLKSKNIILYPIKGTSFNDIKIDHIATGERIVVDTAIYENIFCNTERRIGIPDHKCIVASFKCS